MKTERKHKTDEPGLGQAVAIRDCLFRGGKGYWRVGGLRTELFGCPHVLVVLAFCLAAATDGLAAQPPGYYSEPFRPQFHFTPERNWMNDPNGLVYYEGEYHLFYQHNPFGDKWGHMSWGHAVSPDMVHWRHLPLALPEADGIMCFSGSAVVDWHNTSGFGKDGRPPLVAIYTGYRSSDHLQFQCLAFSNDQGRTWTKYAGNPVINIHSKDFRDPKVQWYEPTRRWIMTVALSAEHKVRFYASTNLIHWTLLSEFGPAGATRGVWECPDLFELPVEGTREKRWVLTVNTGSGSVAGGTGGQYFVGWFDGTRFVLDKDSVPKPTPELVPNGTLLADFEGKTYGNWKVTGNAFGSGPAHGRFSDQNPVGGYKGHGLVNSFYHGDQTTGTLISPEFPITKPFLDFLIGGGASRNTRMDLRVEGRVVRTASGKDDEWLAWRSWDVEKFLGKKARLEIVDQASGGWGHINVDQIMLAGAPAHSASVAALWFDYGPDYYAAVSWSDIPPSDGRRLWLGWMSNGQYAQDVPTAPWRSAMSIPRRVTLRKTVEGIRMVQTPVRELKALRDRPARFRGGDFAAANGWLAENRIQGAQLELEFQLEPETAGVEGVQVLKGAAEATVIGVNWDRGTVFVDRTHSGNVGFNPRFPGAYQAPLAARDSRVKLHVFVDACSVEVFVNGGERVFTVLVFPSADSRGVQFFNRGNGSKIDGLNVWTLKSVWK